MIKRVTFSAVVLLALAIVGPNSFAQTAETPVPPAQAVVETTNSILTAPAPAPESPVTSIDTNTEKVVESTVAVAPETAPATVTQDVQVVTTAVVGAESPISAIVPEISDASSEPIVPWVEPESRTRRAVRINQDILMVTVPILAFFIIARIALLWKISSNRKRIARESNSLEP